MKSQFFVRLFLGSSLATLLSTGVYAAEPPLIQSAGAPKNNGTIILISRVGDNGGGGEKCTIELPPMTSGRVWQYGLVNLGDGCVNDKTESIVFNNIPSATKILLTDASFCSKKIDANNTNEFFRNKYWIELRTTKNTTTPNDTPLTLQTLAAVGKNKIIVPGVQMLDKNLPGGADALFDSLSCIGITTSAPNLPPQPVPPISFTKHNWTVGGPYTNQKTECGPNEVVNGTRRAEVDGSIVKLLSCQNVIQDGKTLEVTDNHWEPAAVWPMYTHATLTCKPDQVLTGLTAVKKDSYYRIKCGTLRDQHNSPLSIIPDETWEPNTAYRCPDNKVRIGHRFAHDPSYDVSYGRCATLKNVTETSAPSSAQTTP